MSNRLEGILSKLSFDYNPVDIEFTQGNLCNLAGILRGSKEDHHFRNRVNSHAVSWRPDPDAIGLIRLIEETNFLEYLAKYGQELSIATYAVNRTIEGERAKKRKKVKVAEKMIDNYVPDPSNYIRVSELADEIDLSAATVLNHMARDAEAKEKHPEYYTAKQDELGRWLINEAEFYDWLRAETPSSKARRNRDRVLPPFMRYVLTEREIDRHTEQYIHKHKIKIPRAMENALLEDERQYNHGGNGKKEDVPKPKDKPGDRKTKKPAEVIDFTRKRLAKYETGFYEAHTELYDLSCKFLEAENWIPGDDSEPDFSKIYQEAREYVREAADTHIRLASEKGEPYFVIKGGKVVKGNKRRLFSGEPEEKNRILTFMERLTSEEARVTPAYLAMYDVLNAMKETYGQDPEYKDLDYKDAFIRVAATLNALIAEKDVEIFDLDLTRGFFEELKLHTGFCKKAKSYSVT
ncbi:MAG: hypothetical protein ABIE94_02410 [archaeon]